MPGVVDRETLVKREMHFVTSASSWSAEIVDATGRRNSYFSQSRKPSEGLPGIPNKSQKSASSGVAAATANAIISRKFERISFHLLPGSSAIHCFAGSN